MRCRIPFRDTFFWVSALAVMVGVFGARPASAQDGEELFKNLCSSCHHPLNNGTGPALQGAKAKWASEAESPELIYTWVRNWEEAVGQSEYATGVSGVKASAMNYFPALKNEQIDAILAYVDGYSEPAGDGGNAAGGPIVAEEDSGISFWWFVVGGILLVVIFAAAGIRRQLAQMRAQQLDQPTGEGDSYVDILKKWATRNQGAVSVIGVVALFSLLVVSYGWMYGVGVVEDHHPSQPIAGFSHQKHVGQYEIDCKTCHNFVDKSKHAGLPAVNICMNCHKGIDGASAEGKEGVAKIREHAGYNPETATYSGETTPIAWNRVYLLPDHVYFNHSQHVSVGGLECVNCHGDMAQQTTAKVVSVGNLEPLGGDPLNKLTRPTLTMGWCIECHGNAGIDLAGNGDYYEEAHRRLTKRGDVYKKILDDEKVTVSELGGWECAKCHY